MAIAKTSLNPFFLLQSAQVLSFITKLMNAFDHQLPPPSFLL